MREIRGYQIGSAAAESSLSTIQHVTEIPLTARQTTQRMETKRMIIAQTIPIVHSNKSL